MFSVMQLMYLIPVIVAVTLAGALGGRNVRGRAKRLMWAGIALVIVSQLSSLLLPVVARASRAGWALSVYSTASTLVSVTGIVLLIVAVGQAARQAAAGPEPRGYPFPSGSPAPAGPAHDVPPGYQPPTGGYPQTQYPAYRPDGDRPDGDRPGTPPYGGRSSWGTPEH